MRLFFVVLIVVAVVVVFAASAAAERDLTVVGDPPCTDVVELDDPTDRTDLVVPADGQRCVPVPGGPCAVDGHPGRFDFLGRCVCERAEPPPRLGERSCGGDSCSTSDKARGSRTTT